MELFSKYKAAALADVALGDCIVVRYSLGQDKGHRHTVAIKIARGEDERDPVGGNGDQTRFRCSSTGMSRRTRAVTFGSRRAVAHPVPSETLATVWPQGSAIMEWP